MLKDALEEGTDGLTVNGQNVSNACYADDAVFMFELRNQS